MTALHLTSGAPSARLRNWKLIPWESVKSHVRRLQLRIAKATKMGRHGKARSLQWLLTHSFYAKLLAVKRVTQNKGKNTPGVDGKLWKTPAQKMQAAYNLKRKGYQSLPLRRIHIPKKNGKLRPLGIPTMSDRAQQALHLIALEPVAEILADKNSYGFRPKRSIHDAIGQCFILLAKKSSPKWILEGDIKSCFDKISHQWLQDNIMMDKMVLKQWLDAGFMEEGTFNTTSEGTPQGGIASPTLANMALDGMEKAIQDVAKRGEKIHFVRYADDFICTAATREILEAKVQPTIIKFLKERGLKLSLEKTKITSIETGFDFLGFNLRKFKEKLLITPSKKGIKAFLEKIRKTIQIHRGSKTAVLIQKLNPIIRGWTNHFRFCVAKRTFSNIDRHIFSAIKRWAKRRHPNKNASWIRKKYYAQIGTRNWCFYTLIEKKGQTDRLKLISASDTSIVRYIKVRAEASPYDPEHQKYFQDRARRGLNVRNGRANRVSH